MVRSRSSISEEPIFSLNGGPGASNLVGSPPSWLYARRDVVTVGYRGADGSVILEIPLLEEALRGKGGDLLGEASIENVAMAINSDVANLTAKDR